MAEVGDFMRVKSVYPSTGEVKTMEALPPGTMLKVAWSGDVNTDPGYNYSKILQIDTVGSSISGTYILSVSSYWPLIGDSHFTQTFLISISGRYPLSQNSVSVKNLTTGIDYDGFVFRASESGSGSNSLYIEKEDGLAASFSLFIIREDTALNAVYSEGAAWTTQTGLTLSTTIYDSNVKIFSDSVVLPNDGEIKLSGESWTAPTFQNNWVNMSNGWATAGYRKMPDGRIEIKGLVKEGSLNTAIFTLPTGYRPNEHRMFTSIQGNGNSVRLTINSNGNVYTTDAVSNSYQTIEASFYP